MENKKEKFIAIFFRKIKESLKCEEAETIWSCPSFIFILVGVVDIVVTILVFYVAKHWENPILVVGGLGVINVIILTIGGVIVRAQERIIETSKVKSEFVSIASHQLRAPLGNVKWVVELLQGTRVGELSDKQMGYIETIQENNERMIKLVNDLLDVSKINEGKIKAVLQAVSFEEIVDQVVSEYNLFAKARNINLGVDIEDGLPLAYIDPKKIKIATQNLVDNAIKYAKKKGKILIKVKKLKENILVQIQDDGVGIPKRQQSHIFERFFRSDNALKHEVIGTGLGLYITKAVIESNKGKIWFVSKENEGATFYFTIPFVENN